MSNAAATLVGQNLGAGKPDRAEASAWKAAFYNTAFLAGVGILFVLLADPIAAAFTDDPAVKPIAVLGLRIISAGFPFYAYGYVITQSFNGAGDTMTPTLINILCLWLGELPLAYVLSQAAGFGPAGVFWAVAFAFSVLSIVAALLFRRGRWKTTRV